MKKCPHCNKILEREKSAIDRLRENDIILVAELKAAILELNKRLKKLEIQEKTTASIVDGNKWHWPKYETHGTKSHFDIP